MTQPEILTPPDSELLPDETAEMFPEVPEKMKAALRRYARTHSRVGGFLTAVLENDLVTAAGLADGGNRPALGPLALWVWNALPSECWGSAEKVESWTRR